MAKKKASAKKASAKKVVKKTASKKTPTKVAKKAAPAKKAKAAKKVTKPAAKKAAAKPKKTVAKKIAKPAATKKVAEKKTSSAKAAPAHLVKATSSAKKMDLSNFVTPLDDRVMIQLSGTEKMTAGGLYIPDTVADTSGNLEGYVVAAGRGHLSKKGHVRPMDVKVGDRVVFAEYSGSKIKIQNEDLIILREGDILGIVSK